MLKRFGSQEFVIQPKQLATRACDQFCHIPSDWGFKIKQRLDKLKPVLDLKTMQCKIIKFEMCDKCLTSDCANDSSCSDGLNFILGLSKHYQGLRTIIRYIIFIKTD